ncbi:putative ATP-dependent endonuclease of the OLD family [Bathymodiolus japonicus methanotrophic gill symbiont]|uniref:ATP-dependent nuclease n=1 Tax=Bathymodiolus japonicus methanotrophic gill symbiont TaxID=113269 RepID=UPI001B796FF3|nr:AAA family ATPase [Bathymodiolus japonicus methanotrophic gill symbiont]GFO73206.1 putative ATP-dependent endonuclease of the OLD family [Bathymodiolus japonicus methanotrophic gill symbiont]
MSILVDKVRIAGFRGIAELEITLPRVTVLIGTNNSGKTSVIKAMQLALGDYSRYLAEEDFYIDTDDKRVDSILVDVRVVAMDLEGKRKSIFDDEWAEHFGDKIQSEANGYQFLALRTQCEQDKIKGGFSITRFALDRWPDYPNWKSETTKRKKQLRKRFDALPFISIDAQRDIHQELREKSSFIGKVLSNVEYDKADITKLEELVKAVNDEAVEKSQPLQDLKEHLEQLNQSFQGSGEAEITPFPKKIRDISKQFTVHFGDQANNSFSMEYHGMGTRSWASMLTVKAFVELTGKNHQEEAKPFFPLIAAEEPEAHLHPNAQRTLYKQLIASNGQIIISTHSPYLAALANQSELRALSIASQGVCVNQLNVNLPAEDKRKLQREVIHSRGELLFSKAIVLSEGETEEQSLPQLFTKYFGDNEFSMGINFIGVSGSGAKYRPFLSFAHDFNIPVFVFSDGEINTTKELKKNYDKIFGETDIDNSPNITILDRTDFEGYLFDSGFAKSIENAIVEIDGTDAIDKWINKKQGTQEKSRKTDQPPCETCKQPIFDSSLRDYSCPDGRKKAMLEILDAKKPRYAQAVTEQLCKLDSDKLPPKIIELFEKIKVGRIL